MRARQEKARHASEMWGTYWNLRKERFLGAFASAILLHYTRCVRGSYKAHAQLFFFRSACLVLWLRLEAAGPFFSVLSFQPTGHPLGQNLFHITKKFCRLPALDARTSDTARAEERLFPERLASRQVRRLQVESQAAQASECSQISCGS